VRNYLKERNRINRNGKTTSIECGEIKEIKSRYMVNITLNWGKTERRIKSSKWQNNFKSK
jgi:hypothetical protein